eukprot:6073797-Pyramimonas_sp.AAC.1
MEPFVFCGVPRLGDERNLFVFCGYRGSWTEGIPVCLWAPMLANEIAPCVPYVPRLTCERILRVLWAPGFT